MERSRREVFTTHAGDRDRLARCPICRMAVEKDHEEALQVQAARLRAPASRGAAIAPPLARAPQPVETYAFELV